MFGIYYLRALKHDWVGRAISTQPSLHSFMRWIWR
ncbi:MAG: hypothetical protein ACI9FJ_000684, partial [Alteromonadaceae bacterium]